MGGGLGGESGIQAQFYMGICWNWQTGTFEVRVLNNVRVRVPLSPPVRI